jgi:hypothetical protein
MRNVANHLCDSSALEPRRLHFEFSPVQKLQIIILYRADGSACICDYCLILIFINSGALVRP